MVLQKLRLFFQRTSPYPWQRRKHITFQQKSPFQHTLGQGYISFEVGPSQVPLAALQLKASCLANSWHRCLGTKRQELRGIFLVRWLMNVDIFLGPKNLRKCCGCIYIYIYPCSLTVWPFAPWTVFGESNLFQPSCVRGELLKLRGVWSYLDFEKVFSKKGHWFALIGCFTFRCPFQIWIWIRGKLVEHSHGQDLRRLKFRWNLHTEEIWARTSRTSLWQGYITLAQQRTDLFEDCQLKKDSDCQVLDAHAKTVTQF